MSSKWNSTNEYSTKEEQSQFRFIQKIPKGKTETIVINLNQSVRYCFAVTAFNELGESNFSNVVCTEKGTLKEDNDTQSISKFGWKRLKNMFHW
jgi:biopolymer transport protein ExbD